MQQQVSQVQHRPSLPPPTKTDPEITAGKAIGIDLGTTYSQVVSPRYPILAHAHLPHSCVGVWQNDHVEIIPNDHGNRTTPSCVSFSDTGHRTGDAAKNQAAVNPQNT